MLKKANRVSLVEQVSSQMEHLIETGHWAVGERLPSEMELMKEFDVSRNTLREAIRALVHAGLLETKQGSGTIVQSSSALGAALQRRIEKSTVIETLEVRLALEREAAQLAAKRRNEKDLESMQECIDQCRRAAEEENLEAFIAADIKFHQAMIKASHNQMLQELYEHITESIRSSIRKLMMLDEYFDFEKEIHSELLESIQQQDERQSIQHVNDYIKVFRKKIHVLEE
ncbi:MAG TPA: FadR/GntR family transcriptional regulator [Bacillota bacterium]|nr:FadR/GntR family transcriptional regulator [Bacillota bacterium]